MPYKFNSDGYIREYKDIESEVIVFYDKSYQSTLSSLAAQFGGEVTDDGSIEERYIKHSKRNRQMNIIFPTSGSLVKFITNLKLDKRVDFIVPEEEDVTRPNNF